TPIQGHDFLLRSGAFVSLSSVVWLLTLYPPTACDAVVYHLPYVKTYLTHQALVPTPHLRYPVFPQVVEMIFVPMMMFGGDVATQGTSFVMTSLTAIILFAWGRQAFSERVGLWAAALWLGNPIVLLVGTWAYIDAGLSLFATA